MEKRLKDTQFHIQGLDFPEENNPLISTNVIAPNDLSLSFSIFTYQIKRETNIGIQITMHHLFCNSNESKLC
jgi:hypothetical protein